MIAHQVDIDVKRGIEIIREESADVRHFPDLCFGWHHVEAHLEELAKSWPSIRRLLDRTGPRTHMRFSRAARSGAKGAARAAVIRLVSIADRWGGGVSGLFVDLERLMAVAKSRGLTVRELIAELEAATAPEAG